MNKLEKVEPNEKQIVGSLNVKAQYPSLDIPFAVKVVAEEFLLSDVGIVCGFRRARLILSPIDR